MSRKPLSILTLTGFVILLLFPLAIPRHSIAAYEKPIFRFDFGAGKTASGYTQVQPTMLYSQERGYGFEPGATLVSLDREKNDALRSDFITSDRPFFFSVALPAGNYKVTVIIGDANEPTDTTVKAELRRLMLERVQTTKGKLETRSFIVNVRTPEITGGGAVKLKDREKTMEWWAWDEKLTLEFNGSRLAICAVEIAPANVPTVFLLGDSTMCDQPREPFASWGQMLPRFFDARVSVANHAESGEAIRSSIAARRFDKVWSLMKPGDYLFLQFGHNDQKEKGEGVGAFTSYKSDLKKIIAETRQRGGIPVLVTSVQRRNFGADGKILSTLGDYPEAVRQVAQEDKIALIDLHAMSKLFYEALGADKSAAAFKEGDGTHHNNYGSYELAKCIVEGIKANKLGLAKYLVKDAPAFDPRKPDAMEQFKIPASPIRTETKPLGN